jgi:hypothetical protein
MCAKQIRTVILAHNDMGKKEKNSKKTASNSNLIEKVEEKKLPSSDRTEKKHKELDNKHFRTLPGLLKRQGIPEIRYSFVRIRQLSFSEAVFPTGRFFGCITQKGPSKIVSGRTNLRHNFGRIFPEMAEKGPNI